METQTRYDLNAAIESWRSELAAQPNLTAEVRSELETHLRDAIAGFQQRGLNDEESFWLARRRVGQPHQLSEEFVKANPAAAWRERVLWMATAFLAVNFLQTIFSGFYVGYTKGNTRHFLPWRFEDVLPDWVLFYLPHWLRNFPNTSATNLLLNSFSILTPIVICVVILASSRLKLGRGVWSFIFQSRRHFILTGVALVLAVDWLSALLSNPPQNAEVSVATIFFGRMFYGFPWTCLLIALVAWLMPPQNQKTPKRA